MTLMQGLMKEPGAATRFYWLPIIRDEMNKAPQLQQNPGYN